MRKRIAARLGLVVAAAVGPPGCCSAPSYTPAYWNDAGTIQYGNNCYNYGNNKRTDTFAQPGRRSGDYPNAMSCADVSSAAVSDGVARAPASGVCPKRQCRLALVVDPGTYYHWYRLDKNGVWTHKPGGTRATNLDNSGNPISNPETANRCGGWLCYTDFCGYFCSCSSSIEGKGRENIN